MNVHSSSHPSPRMSTVFPESAPDRREQILRAAMVEFCQARLSSDDACRISARKLASAWASFIAISKARKRSSPPWRRNTRTTCRICSNAPAPLPACSIRSKFSSPRIAATTPRKSSPPSWSISTPRRDAIENIAHLVRGVMETGLAGLTDVIARAPEMRDAPHGLTPREIAELILATARGSMMRDVLDHSQLPADERRERQLKVVRQLWSLLFTHANEPALA